MPPAVSQDIPCARRHQCVAALRRTTTPRPAACSMPTRSMGDTCWTPAVPVGGARSIGAAVGKRRWCGLPSHRQQHPDGQRPPGRGPARRRFGSWRAGACASVRPAQAAACAPVGTATGRVVLPSRPHARPQASCTPVVAAAAVCRVCEVVSSARSGRRRSVVPVVTSGPGVARSRRVRAPAPVAVRAAPCPSGAPAGLRRAHRRRATGPGARGRRRGKRVCAALEVDVPLFLTLNWRSVRACLQLATFQKLFFSPPFLFFPFFFPKS